MRPLGCGTWWRDLRTRPAEEISREGVCQQGVACRMGRKNGNNGRQEKKSLFTGFLHWHLNSHVQRK